MKADFVFAGIWTVLFRKKRQTDARFMDDALKTRGIKYSNIQTRLLFAPHPVA